ncbi:hypothetical protein [Nostoc sp. LEGE 12450]|uniref:hypothetical protein n=1 Tax=Nostoc sp. LEGE 12450 TaxID=1828643 RepID=UPI0018802E3D|nr:hypothetical protein [Nostoc sp. LEGE 12450]MBE8985735.1 hypothetical protein [Nostoc sp. LEGE 12450]
MTLEQLQKQVLELPISDAYSWLRLRWTLVQTLLESLQRETSFELKKSKLSRLRGIAKGTEISSKDMEVD